MINTLQYYISCFTSMNCNKYRGQVAPHKAMMLIAVMDEIANGHLTNGFVPHNDRMVKAFECTWQKYISRIGKIARIPGWWLNRKLRMRVLIRKNYLGWQHNERIVR